MCVAHKRLCQKWVVRGAPKRMSTTVNSGAESERQRSREIMAGFVGRAEKSQQVLCFSETQ